MLIEVLEEFKNTHYYIIDTKGSAQYLAHVAPKVRFDDDKIDANSSLQAQVRDAYNSVVDYLPLDPEIGKYFRDSLKNRINFDKHMVSAMLQSSSKIMIDGFTWSSKEEYKQYVINKTFEITVRLLSREISDLKD
jgi:hypothetical protein